MWQDKKIHYRPNVLGTGKLSMKRSWIMAANYKTLEYDLERFLVVINKHACNHETARDGKIWEFINTVDPKLNARN